MAHREVRHLETKLQIVGNDLGVDKEASPCKSFHRQNVTETLRVRAAGPEVAASTQNLLFECARLSPGAQILIVGESNQAPFFDPGVCAVLAEQARALGVSAEHCLVDATSPEIPPEVVAKMHAVDANFFFSRLGGRARFCVPDVPGVVVNCHGETPAHMESPFTEVSYRVQQAIHDALISRISTADSYRIVAPCGTDLRGTIPAQQAETLVDFALQIFPVMIFPPIVFRDFSGRLVIDHFVTSSATRTYDDSILIIDTPLQAHIAAGRIEQIEGPAPLVDRLVAQMTRAAAMTGGDPMRVNSWHTGINPNTFTNSQAREDPDRWGAIAFGSPRYTHFHASGHDPGDIAFSLLDATITFDDVPFWRDGRFVFLDLPEVAALIPPDLKPVLTPSVCPGIGI